MNTFKSGNFELDYKIDIADNWSNKTVIYIPWMSFKINEVDRLSNSFVMSGYNFVRFNFRYHQKRRDLGNFSLKTDLEDLTHLFTTLKIIGVDLKNCWIIAKSFGWVKAFLLGRFEFKCYGFLAPATFFDSNSNIDLIRNIKYRDITKLQDIKLSTSILSNWNDPSIFIHGTSDSIIDIENSRFIYDYLSSSKEFYEIYGMWHSINEENFQIQITNYLVNFFKNNL